MFNTFKCSIDDFDGFVSDSELEDIVDNVRDVVFDWMFSNPSEYIQAYISETLYRFRRLQQKSYYELMQAYRRFFGDANFINFNSNYIFCSSLEIFLYAC